MSWTARCKQRAPELLLGLYVWMSFFAGLGEMDIWGRREQRLAAETADTLRGHWIIARLAGKPRLEKPPLCRWLSALSILATGQRNEFALRFPYAVGGLVTVVILYVWGRQLGDRVVGLVAAGVFCTSTLVVSELRQASADALLVPLLTAALWCLWQSERAEGRKSRRWRLLSGVATGLGVLAKGPVAVMLVLASLFVWAAMAKHDQKRWWHLWDPWWWAAAILTAAPWPVLVVIAEPRAPLVWLYEMGIKLGAVPEPAEYRTLPLVLRLPELTIPWVPLAIAGLLSPWLLRSEEQQRAGWWLVWGWAAGNLVLFSFWKISKPSYYLPCLPAVALLGGRAWRAVLDAGASLGYRQRVLIWTQWSLFAAGGVGLLGAAWWLAPQWLVLAAAILLLATACYVLSVVRWNRVDGLLWLGAGHGLLALVLFTVVLPSLDSANSHRAVASEAARLRRALRAPVLAMPHAEESLWFYMPHPPRPVPDADAVARIVRRRGRALVIGDRRDFRRLQGHHALRVVRIHDESRRRGRKGMIIARVELLAPRLARHPH